MSAADFDRHARKIRRAAAASMTHDRNGLEVLFKAGFARDWWYFRDAYMKKFEPKDYAMAICLLACMGETGDLPKTQGAAL